MFSAKAVRTFIDAGFSQLRKTQRANLALCLGAVLAQCRLTLSGVGRFFPQCQHHRHRVKRVYRFLSNPRLDPLALQIQWLRNHLALDQRDGPLPLLIDDTHLCGTWYALCAAIAHKGRALPLAWAVYDRSRIAQSQNRLEMDFLRRVFEELRPLRVVFIGDRGFGKATLIRFLLQHDVDFVLRIKKKTTITRRGESRLAGAIPFHRGRSRLLDRVLYSGWKLPVNLVISHRAPAHEPWFLVTSLASAPETHRLYRLRMTIEECFRDLKDRMQLESVQLTDPHRIETLLLVLTLAYLAFRTLGAAAIQRHGQHAYVAWKTISSFVVGHSLALANPNAINRLLLQWAPRTG